MGGKIILFIISLLFLLNIVVSETEANPESEIFMAITARISEIFNKLTEAGTNGEIKKVPGLVKILEKDLDKFDAAFLQLNALEKTLLMDDYLSARKSFNKGLLNAYSWME